MFSLHCVHTNSGPIQPPVHVYWILGALFRGVMLSGRDADHSPPFSVKGSIRGAIPPAAISLHSMELNYAEKQLYCADHSDPAV
jgi:hypothetical protein